MTDMTREQAVACPHMHRVVVDRPSAATSSGIGCLATGGRCNPGTTKDCPTTPDVGVEDWKARALAAEADIERMTDAFNRENGPTFMGEPVLPPEKMVELGPGVSVPTWLLDHARRIELYMKSKMPGPWRIGGIQSHDYPHPQPAKGEAVAEVCRPAHPRPDSATFVRMLKDNVPNGTKLYANPPAAKPDAVAGLVEKWREDAAAAGWLSKEGLALALCAVELAAALSAKGENEDTTHER